MRLYQHMESWMDMNAPYNVYADSYLKSKLFSQNQFQSAFALQRTFVMY